MNAVADGTAVGRGQELDLDEIQRGRDRRFKERRKIIMADPTLTDAQRAVLLSRRLCSTAVTAELLGVKPQRASAMRSSRRFSNIRSPHPSLLPEIDAIVGYVAGVPDPGYELGELVRWLLQRGTHLLRRDGHLVERPDATPAALPEVAPLLTPLGEYRPGSVRVVRTTKSRKARVPQQAPRNSQ